MRRATAYHEAGHAVAALLHGIPVEHVTIRAGDGLAGHVQHGAAPRNAVQMHQHGVIAMAGEAAQRRFNPRSVRSWQGNGDRAVVVDWALNLTGSIAQAELMARL